MPEKQPFISPPVQGTAAEYASSLISRVSAHFHMLYPDTFDSPQRRSTFVEDSTRAIMSETLLLREIDVLRSLYGHEPYAHTTPQGLEYQELSIAKEAKVETVSIGYFGPHPSDFVDFLGGTMQIVNNARIFEFLVTAGEKGVGELSENKTKTIRQQETTISSEMLGITTIPLPNLLPDGEVIHNMDLLIKQIKEQIIAYNLQIIFAPAPEVDHPDHVAVHFGVLRALEELKKEGYLQNRQLPALYITDPEFGFNSGGEWAFREVSNQFPTKYPVSSSFLRRGSIHQVGIDPIVVPDFIIAIPNEIMAEAIEALYVHKTQMWETDGREKPYRRKIPAFKRLRGMQIDTNWGEGVRQYIIPGITSSENTLLMYLPEHSMHALTMLH